MSARDKDSKLNKCFIQLSGEFAEDGLQNLNAFLGFAARKIERRQNANDGVAGRNGEKAGFVQAIDKLNGSGPFARGKCRDVGGKFKPEQQTQTTDGFQDVREL